MRKPLVLLSRFITGDVTVDELMSKLLQDHEVFTQQQYKDIQEEVSSVMPFVPESRAFQVPLAHFLSARSFCKLCCGKEKVNMFVKDHGSGLSCYCQKLRSEVSSLYFT